MVCCRVGGWSGGRAQNMLGRTLNTWTTFDLDPKHLLLSTGSCRIAAADGGGARAIVNALLAGPTT